MKVLFVDDDIDLREAMKESLEIALGVRECVTVGSLGELQQNYSLASNCKLAILDINLGRGQPSGVDVFNWLKGQGFNGRIVFLTGHASSDPRVMDVSQLNSAKILSKPISFEDLKKILPKAGE